MTKIYVNVYLASSTCTCKVVAEAQEVKVFLCAAPAICAIVLTCSYVDSHVAMWTIVPHRTGTGTSLTCG